MTAFKGNDPWGPMINNCRWDEETKTKVKAFARQNLADDQRLMLKEYGDELDPESVGAGEDEIARAEMCARRLLNKYNLDPLTENDIRVLLEKAVDRVLAQAPQN